MLSYQHGYHAGNFADVLKHSVLLAIIKSLHKKDKPYSVIDVHAGDGVYDLSGPMANKTGEYKDGIGRLFEHDDLPELIADYIQAVRAIQPDQELTRYFGSSAWIADSLREQDKAICAEAHPQVFDHLSHSLPEKSNLSLHHGNGFDVLRASFAELQGRGLAIMDPSYEVSEDFSQVSEAWGLLQKHWRNAVQVIWYPLLGHKPIAAWRDLLIKRAGNECLRVELTVSAPEDGGMYGTGLLIRNPPWGLQDSLQEALPYLAEQLAQGHSDWMLQLSGAD